jgi:hypothetical protein
MKASTVLLAVSCLALAGCSPNATEPPQENLGPVYLTVDKSIYSPADTVLVTLHNDSEEPVFLGGCSALFLATKTDTGWNEQLTKICVWEGIIQKVGPNSIYQEKYEAKYFRGEHKFGAGFGLGCQEGMPTGQAKCTRWGKIYSPVFSVSGIPKPAIIAYTEIPRPYSKSTYFLYGGGREVPELRFANGNSKLILQRLLEKNFNLREAWNATGEWGCPLRIPTWEQMIIRLEAPDQRLYDFGVTADSSRIQIFGDPACLPTWEHYRFD